MWAGLYFWVYHICGDIICYNSNTDWLKDVEMGDPTGRKGHGRGDYGGLVCLTKIVGPKLMLQLHNEATKDSTTNPAQIPSKMNRFSSTSAFSGIFRVI